jgi:hypothetical protein
MAHAILAILLASAIAATLVGRRANNGIKSLQQGARRAVALKHQIFVLEPEYHAAPAAADIFVLV